MNGLIFWRLHGISNIRGICKCNSSRSPFLQKLRIESLEERRLLSVGGIESDLETCQVPAAFAGSDSIALVGETVRFDGRAVSPDGNIAQYIWDFESDGVSDFSSAETGCTTHSFNSPGDYECRLTVKDINGQITIDSRRLKVVPEENGGATAEPILPPADPASGGSDGTTHRYAIMINGGGESRFWTDVQLGYDMLTDGYGFSSSDIYLLNYNGKNPDGVNPDGMIDYSATAANLQTVISQLASTTDMDDEVFVWITDHGRGYSGPLSEGGKYLGYCDGRISVDPGDEADFLESNFQLRSLFTGGDYRSNHGLNTWEVRRQYSSSTKTEFYRNMFVSRMDSIYIEGLGTTVTDNDVYIEDLVDYALGDTNRDGYIDTSAGEVFDYDNDGNQPYNASTGVFDEGDWGAIDKLTNDYNSINTMAPEGAYPYKIFDEGFQGKLCIDLGYAGGPLEVDGRDEDNAGLFDWMDVNQDGDIADMVSVDEAVCLYSGDLYDDQLNDLLNQLSVAKITVVAEPCFSGGLVEDLTSSNRVIATATIEDAVSWGNYFIRDFVAALHKQDGNGNPVDADTDDNGYISMLEAFNYAADKDPCDEIPQYDDNGDGVSHPCPVPAGGDGELGAETYLAGAFSATLDFGDAPTSAQSGFSGTYPTTLADNGARHTATGPMLGANRDIEADGKPTAVADGDDTSGSPGDEDGVIFTSALIGGRTATAQVTASAVGYLNAWIDFTCDGDWADAGEQIFSDVLMVAGLNSLSFMVPATPTDRTYARFRLSTLAGVSYDGPATDGEVEDYAFGTIAGSKWNDFDGDAIWDGGEPGLADWTIYADLNQNGQLDPDEPFDRTDANGNYRIAGIPSGTYTVAEESSAGWQQTFAVADPILIGPSVTASIHDANLNGTGDSFNLAPWTGLLRRTTTVEDRATVEFNLVSAAQWSLIEATLELHLAVNNSGGAPIRTFTVWVYPGNGSADLSDFSISGINIGEISFPVSEHSHTFQLDVRSAIQQLLSTGVPFAGVRLNPLGSDHSPDILTSSSLSLAAAGSNVPCEIVLGAGECRQNIDFSNHDISPPGVALAVPLLTNDTTPAVTVSAADNDALPEGTVVRLDVDLNHDGDFLDSGEEGYTPFTLNAGAANFDIVPGLAEGIYGLRARLSDRTGNEGASDLQTLVVDITGPTVAEVVDVMPDPRHTPIPTVDVDFSEPIDSSTFTVLDLTLTRNGSPVTLTSAIQISLVSGTTYRISGLSGFTSSEGMYSLTVIAGGIKDLAGNAGTGSSSDTWIVTTPPIARWDGGGVDNEWMTPENWDNDMLPMSGEVLVFPHDPGVVQRICNNNFPSGTVFHSLRFEGAGYLLTGNPIDLTSGIIDNSSRTPGNVVEMDLDVNVFTPTIEVLQSLRIEGNISGTGGIAKTGGGALTLTGLNTYTGPTLVSAGSLVTQNIGSGSRPADLVKVKSGSTLTAVSITADTLIIGGDLLLGSPAAADASSSIIAEGGPTVAVDSSSAFECLAATAETAPAENPLLASAIPVAVKPGVTVAMATLLPAPVGPAPAPSRFVVRDLLFAGIEKNALTVSPVSVAPSTILPALVPLSLPKQDALQVLAEISQPGRVQFPSQASVEAASTRKQMIPVSVQEDRPNPRVISAVLAAARQTIFQSSIHEPDQAWLAVWADKQHRKKRPSNPANVAVQPEYNFFID